MIFFKDLKDCPYFEAGDKSRLCELLHPEREEKSLQMGFSLAHALIKPGERTLTHSLKTSSEFYYILAGEGIIHIDEEEAPLRPGLVVYIPPKAKQFVENSGESELVFLCLVYPPWSEEDEVIF